jgi:membrane fusion protein (multidrug efflux system)
MIGEFFANMQPPAMTVSATTVERSTWTPEIRAIGTLWAIQGVDVAAQVAGVVQSIAFTANDRVAEGDLLVQIEDSVERADLMSAEAALARDRASLERAQRLRETGVSSEATLEEAESAMAASESALARIQAVLDQKAIEAPFSGVIGIPRVEVGQYVQPGTTVATLQQLDTMRVDFTVPEQQIDQITMDQPATFGLTEENFGYQGRVIGIDPKIDPQTRLVSVRAEVENPKSELRPGQFVRVRVELPAAEGVIALPQTAVVTSLYGDYVYVVEEADAAASASPTPATDSAQPAEGGNDAALRETLPAEASADAEPAAETAAPEAAAPESQSGEATSQAPAEGTAASAPAEGEKLVAKQVFVKIGRRQGDLIEIESGLEPGQVVVTSGQNKLANNTPIVINNDVDPAELAQEDGDGAS